MKFIITLAALLTISNGTWAYGKVKLYGTPQHVTYAISNSETGEFTTITADGVTPSGLTSHTAYLKVTPDAGYSIAQADITVQQTVSGGQANAPRRAPEIGGTISLTETETVHVYSFTMPDDDNVNVLISGDATSMFGTEEVVSAEKTWTFREYENGDKTSFSVDDGLYLRAISSRYYTISDLETPQTLTFSDGFKVHVGKVITASSGLSYSTSGSSPVYITTANSRPSNTNNGTQLLAFNANVAGTVYVLMQATETANYRPRIYFYKSGDTGMQQVVNNSTTTDTEIHEFSYTSTEAGSFFIGSANKACKIYAIRFVPTGTDMTNKATLDLTIMSGGSVSVKVGDAETDMRTFDKNTDVTLTATANEYYNFTKWTIGEDEQTDNPYTLNMDANKTVAAVFTSTETITQPSIAFDANGVVTITEGTSSLDGATIKTYYTTDGSEPTESSLLYDAQNKPEVVSGTSVRAISINEATKVASEEATQQTYIYDVTTLTKISDTTTWTFDSFAKDRQLSNTNVYGYKGLYIKGHSENNYATVKEGTAAVTIEGEEIAVGKYLYFPGGNTSSTASTVANNPTADRAAFCTSVPGTVYVYMKGRYKDGSDRYLIIDVNGTQHKTLITQEDNADITRLISVDIPMIPEEGANVYIGSSAACDIYAIKFIKKDTYTLTTTINPEEKGEIEVKYSGQEETTADRTFITGASIEVTAKNTVSGYTFKNWSGTDAPTGEEANQATITLTMNADKSLTANYELQSYAFSAAVATEGTGTIIYKVEGSEENSTATTFAQGTRVVLTATPADGYLFDSWKVNNVVDTEHTTNTLTVTVNAETTVIATFKPEETVDATKAWTFNNLPTDTVFNSISDVNKAYLRGATAPNRTLTVKELDAAQTLTFTDGTEMEVNKYIASNAAASGAGSLTGASTAASTDKDSDSKLLGAGMFAVNTTVPGTLYAQVSSVTANKKIRIYFADGTEIKNQTWTPADTEITEISYTTTAENGGTFFVGGVEAAFNIYAVRFVPTSEAVRYTLTLTQPAAGGTIAATVNGETVDGSMEVLPGAEVMLTATPASGYQMGNWKDGEGTAIGTIPQSISTTMTMPIKALTVSAAFTAQPTDIPSITTETVWTFDGMTAGQKLAGAGTYEYNGLYIGGHSTTNFAAVTAGDGTTSTNISADVTNYIVLAGGYNSDIAASETANTYKRDAISFHAGVPGTVSVYMSGTYAEGRTFNIWNGGTKYTTDMPNDNSALLVTQEIGTAGAVFIATSAGSNKIYAIKFEPALPQPKVAWKENTAEGKAIYTITSSDDNNIKYQLGDADVVDAGAKTADVEVSEKTTLKAWSYNDARESVKVEVTLLATPIVESNGTFDFQTVKEAMDANVNVVLESEAAAYASDGKALYKTNLETAATFAGKMAFSELAAAGNIYLRNDKGFLSVKQGQGALYMAILGAEAGKSLTITVDAANATALTHTGTITFGQPYEIEAADLINGNLVIKLTDFTGTLNIRSIAITDLKLTAPKISVKGLSEDKTKSVYTITYNSKDVLHYKMGTDGTEETPSPATAGIYDVAISANGTLTAWATREGATQSDVTTRSVYVPTDSVYTDGIYDFTKVKGTTPVEIVTSEQTVGGQTVYASNAITAATFDRRFAFSTITGTDVRLIGGTGLRVAKGKIVYIALKNLEKDKVFAINYTTTSDDDGILFKSVSILDGATVDAKVVSGKEYNINEAGNILLQVSNANVSLDISSIKLGSKMKTEQADVEYVVTNDEATVTGFTTAETASEITIPASVDGATVTSIAEGTFTEENTANVTSIDLSETAVTFDSGTTRETVDELKNINSATLIYLPSTANVTGTNVVTKTGTGTDATYTCDDYQIMDGKASSVPHAFTAAEAKITRTFTSGVKCTVCLPYQFTASGGNFYKFTGISDGKVQMTEQTGILDANTPYIFVPSSDATEGASASNVTVSISDAPETVDAANKFTFKGIFEKIVWDESTSEGVYGFAALAQDGADVGQFVRVGAGASIDANRAYLKYEGEGTLNGLNSAPRRAPIVLPNTLSIKWIHAQGGATTIRNVEQDSNEDAPAYNLNGQRVGKDYKGIVVVNGKKVRK